MRRVNAKEYSNVVKLIKKRIEATYGRNRSK